MAGQASKTTRNRKIEPLNWAETASSPALKGMMSFLDIKPEEVRSGHFRDVPNDLDPRGLPVSETPTGSDSLTGGVLPDVAAEARPSPVKAVIEMRPKREALSAFVPEPTELPSTGGATFKTYAQPGYDPPPVSVSLPVRESVPAIGLLLGSVPSQNRKIRRCRLSQDAHSAGEETLYRILWEAGKPESDNPLAARTVRIGYAELANRARMHKANVRLNLANLTAKLAIEQSGDFSSRDMIAKAYRVLSYKEILERRRAAGLEYVVRQKNVIFVTPEGVPIALPGLPPAKKRVLKPAQAPSRVDDTYPIGDSLPGSESPIGKPVFDLRADVLCVSEAMNTFGAVDDAATDHLIRACRKVRPDAEAEEIAFFVREKLELTRTNRSITNPVGLILATVPQSFVGHSFDTFRRRHQESKRIAEEDRLRKLEDDRKLTEWIIRDAEQTLANPNASEKRRTEAADILVRYSLPIQ